MELEILAECEGKVRISKIILVEQENALITLTTLAAKAVVI